MSSSGGSGSGGGAGASSGAGGYSGSPGGGGSGGGGGGSGGGSGKGGNGMMRALPPAADGWNSVVSRSAEEAERAGGADGAGAGGALRAQHKQWLVFEVADTGCGVAAEGLRRLFKEYVQARRGGPESSYCAGKSVSTVLLSVLTH